MDLIWEGLFYGPSGYAEAARNYVLALTQAGARVRIVARDVPCLPSPIPPSLVEKLRSMEILRVAPDAPMVQHIQPHSFHLPMREQPRLRVGYTVFETDRIPTGWVWPCNSMDEVWVPCAFNRKSFAFSGVKLQNLYVVPHAVDTERFRPGLQPLPITNRRGFQFLSVFQWQRRKGWDLLLRAYLDAFGPADDVSLLLKTEAGAEGPLAAEVRAIAKGRPTPPILLDTQVMGYDAIPRLYAASDCFVLPFRGDGFALPLAEAMACGIPVIATRWGGPVDYVTDDNGYLVDVERLAAPDPEYAGGTGTASGHSWAEPDVQQLARHMRAVFQNRPEAKRKAERARIDVEAKLGYGPVADIILERLEPLLEKARPHISVRPTRPRGRSILVDAPVGEAWSFGEIGTQVALALDSAGYDVYLRPWNPEIAGTAGGRLGRLLAKGQRPCDIHMRVSHGDSLDILDGKLRVGLTCCDTTVVPPHWVEGCNRMSAVLVPSTFSAAVFQSHGVTAPIQVYPYGLDPSTFKYVERPQRDVFTFLTLAAAQKRKGTDLLIAAFKGAFPQETDVRLKLVSNPPYRLEQFDAGDKRISYVFGSHTPAQVAAFYADADCFILPTRSGAFEMTPLEAMATGLPVIVTGWSGPLDYATPENAYLLLHEGMEPAFEGRPEQGLWVVPSLLHLQELMRHVYTHREEARLKGQRASRDAHARWTWDSVTAGIIPFLDLLLEE